MTRWDRVAAWIGCAAIAITGIVTGNFGYFWAILIPLLLY